jgi:hypothetical protein
VPFLARDDLERWRDQTASSVVREPSWESLDRFLRVFLRNALGVNGQRLDEFMADLPQALQRTLKYVSEERLADFKAKAIAKTAALVGEYLG